MSPRVTTTSSRPTARAISPESLTMFGLWIAWSPDASCVGRRLDAATEPTSLGRDASSHVMINDRWMSRQHFELFADGAQRLVVRDLATRNGLWHNGRRVAHAVLAAGDLVRAGGTLFVAAEGFDPHGDDLGIVGLSGALAIVRHQVQMLARATVVKTVGPDLQTRSVALPVHVTGETGVGKELVAGALHRCSGRAGPFIARNVATIPRELVATELFGHARGAFTGADRERMGLFQAAESGTLFLDEIAETPDVVQAAMLTALDTGSIMSVGSTRTTRVDVRTITATHRDLEHLVADGRFRQDLYHRLTTASITVPPLRHRRLDVLVLAAHFLHLGGALDRLRTSAEAMYWMADALEALRESPWPGNVRQLQGWVSHVCAMVARGLPTEGAPWPDSMSFAAMVPIRATIHVSGERGARSARVSPSELTPQPITGGSTETIQLFLDAVALESALVERFAGNVAALARWAAPGLGLRESAARRKIYDVLGTERLAALRRGPAE